MERHHAGHQQAPLERGVAWAGASTSEKHEGEPPAMWPILTQAPGYVAATQKPTGEVP